MSTYAELLREKKEFNEDIDQRIKTARAQEASNELVRIKQAINDFGFNATELGLNKLKTKNASTVQKPAVYADDNGNTFTGRGAPPAWVRELYDTVGTDKDKRKEVLEKYRIAK